MGRKPKGLTPEQIGQVEGLASVLSMDQLADYFGIARSTFQEMCAREPEISGMYKRGRSKAVGAVAQGLLQRARDGDTASAIFYLKTQAGWRETSVTEHTGKDGGPIQTEVTSDAAFAQLASLLGGVVPGAQGGADSAGGVAEDSKG